MESANMSSEARQATDRAYQLISDFGKQIGIASITFDDDGRCDLAFDGQRMTIGIDKTMGHMYLESPILEIPSAPSKNFYGWVLEANFTSFSNGIGCLALDREYGNIVWLDRRPVKDMTHAQFDNWLSASIERAEFWAKKLPEQANSAELTDQSADMMMGSEVVFRP